MEKKGERRRNDRWIERAIETTMDNGIGNDGTREREREREGPARRHKSFDVVKG